MKVVVGEEEVPIDVFGHGDLHFLLLVAFDVVDLGEDYETEELYDNHWVELTSREDQDETEDHQDSSPGALVEIWV